MASLNFCNGGEADATSMTKSRFVLNVGYDDDDDDDDDNDGHNNGGDDEDNTDGEDSNNGNDENFDEDNDDVVDKNELKVEIVFLQPWPLIRFQQHFQSRSAVSELFWEKPYGLKLESPGPKFFYIHFK